MTSPKYPTNYKGEYIAVDRISRQRLMNPKQLITIENPGTGVRENCQITTTMDNYSPSFKNPMQHPTVSLPNLTPGTHTNDESITNNSQKYKIQRS